MLVQKVFVKERRWWQFRPTVTTLLICASAIMFSCSSIAATHTSDPWREANGYIFKWNDYFDQLVVRPSAFAYTTFLPRIARQGIGNFFSNIDDINVLVNDILQLKLAAAAGDGSRLLLNSSVGLGGFLDVARSLGLRKNEEDFGQTLATWGFSSGPYVMLPVFGASTVRDSFGLIIDTVFNPLQRVEDHSLRLGLFLLDETDSRSGVLALDELITGDRYLFIREAYLQRREYLNNDGMLDDPFGDF